MKEHDFVKVLVLSTFNNQFGKHLNDNDFNIICIPKKQDFPIAFEIYTNRTDDFLRLRVYLQIGKSDYLQTFKLEVNPPFHNSTVEDEVWVTLGSIDVYHLESRYLKEEYLYNCPEQTSSIILTEDGFPILSEDGSYVLTE
jgi:hypothetical protein